MSGGEPDLRVSVGRSLRLRNPVVAASGTYGYGVEYLGVADPAVLGAVVVKGLSLEPARGLPPPRLVETPAGVLNAIGLQNIGVTAFVAEKLPRLRETGVTVVANCWGTTVDEYRAVVAALSAAPGLAALELNISSPNKREWGRIIATDPDRTAEVVRAAREMTDLPLWVKLSPNVADMTTIARAAVSAGADALTVANTLLGMAVDVRARRPALASVTGGLSGPAVKPVALRHVHSVCQAVEVPVLGCGGVRTAEDALEFLLVGAQAVQVGTATLYDPRAPERVLRGIRAYLRRRGLQSVSQVIGALKTGT